MSNENKECLNILSKEEVLILVQNHLKTGDFLFNNYVIKPASENPLGFLGEHMKLIANIIMNNKNEELIYFVKKIPTDEFGLDYAEQTRAFYKEIELYKSLFIDMDNAQNSVIRTKWRPDFYYSRDYEILVVEDLSIDGYYMLPEKTLMNEEHIKASLKAMAAMHAASIILEEKLKQENIKINDFYENLIFETEVTDKLGHPGSVYFNAGIQSELVLVDLLTNYNVEEKVKIKNELPDRLKRIFRLVEPSKKFKNVFVHGDLWSNNLLFRKDENEKLEALLVDFQQVRYGPPAQDIMMLLYLVQNKNFRDEKLKEMIKYYHDAFAKELKNNNLDVDSLLSFEELIESCDFYFELGLVYSILVFQYIIAPSDVMDKYFESKELFYETVYGDRSKMIEECFLKDENFRFRMSEVLNEIIVKYILN